MLDNIQKGKLLIFSAPSGSGKTTLVKYIMSQIDTLSFSISATSRKIRSNEVNGKDYYFLSVEDFKKRLPIMNSLNGRKFTKIDSTVH